MRCDNAPNVRYAAVSESTRVRCARALYVRVNTPTLFTTKNNRKEKVSLRIHILCSCWSVCLWWRPPPRCHRTPQSAPAGSCPWCGRAGRRRIAWSMWCPFVPGARWGRAVPRARQATRPPSTCLAQPPSRRPPVTVNTVTAAGAVRQSDALVRRLCSVVNTGVGRERAFVVVVARGLRRVGSVAHVACRY